MTMKKGLDYYIKNIESRVKRLEETIILKISVVANILNFEEEVGFADTITIHSRVPNGTFFIGYSALGTDYVGDLRGSPVLLYSGS